MTFDLAHAYICRRVQELGYGDEYHLRMKYLNLGPGEKRIVEAYNQIIILVKTGVDTKVESEMGVMDESDFFIKENQCEHQNLITITNKGESNSTVQYIQVIPKRRELCP